MQDIIDQINELSKNEIPQRHTYFQLKYFLIGNEPTNQSRMWQCLRELKTRRDSISSIHLEIDETKDKIDLLEIEKEKFDIEKKRMDATDDSHHKELNIRIRQNNRKIEACKQNLIQLEERKKGILEECVFFADTFKNIEKIEKLKNFDDLDVQKEYWGAKLSRKLDLKLLNGGQIDSELIDTIMALPDEMPIKIAISNLLVKRQKDLMQQAEKTNLPRKEKANDSI
jgi:hypothetical protein